RAARIRSTATTTGSVPRGHGPWATSRAPRPTCRYARSASTATWYRSPSTCSTSRRPPSAPVHSRTTSTSATVPLPSRDPAQVLVRLGSLGTQPREQCPPIHRRLRHRVVLTEQPHIGQCRRRMLAHAHRRAVAAHLRAVPVAVDHDGVGPAGVRVAGDAVPDRLRVAAPLPADALRHHATLTSAGEGALPGPGAAQDHRWASCSVVLTLSSYRCVW